MIGLYIDYVNLIYSNCNIGIWHTFVLYTLDMFICNYIYGTHNHLYSFILYMYLSCNALNPPGTPGFDFPTAMRSSCVPGAVPVTTAGYRGFNAEGLC